MLVEVFRPGDAGVQVEQAAGLDGGERDQVTPCLVGYERRRGVCPLRGETLSTGLRSPFFREPSVARRNGRDGPGAERAVTARNAWPSMDKVTCRYQAR